MDNTVQTLKFVVRKFGQSPNFRVCSSKVWTIDIYFWKSIHKEKTTTIFIKIDTDTSIEALVSTIPIPILGIKG